MIKSDAGSSAAVTFHGWLTLSTPGSQFVYFTGELGRAREQLLTMRRENARHSNPDPALDALSTRVEPAEQALQASEAGLVQLVQRRIGPTTFEYIAQKATPPGPKSGTQSAQEKAALARQSFNEFWRATSTSRGSVADGN